LRLTPGDPAAIRSRYDEVLSAKGATQPLAARTAGCMFRNPSGMSAGRLMDQAGLKNMCVGGARISDVHANFIVNDGDATATQIRDLAERARAAVHDRFGVTLDYEVILW
jgi:UDP-N-acetylmuramate dehydrogenase